MKAPGFRFTPALQRQLGVPLVACLAGFVGAWLLWPLDTQALDALQLEVAQLKIQAETQMQAPLPRRQGEEDWPTNGDGPRLLQAADPPDLAEGSTVWPWLQQRLRAQGLQVQLLRPQAVNGARTLPEQGVAVRLQGRWHDWLAVESALHRHAPWWVIDQWQVVPVGPQPGDVRIDLQLRLGFRPPALPAQGPTPRVWPEWPVLADREPMPGIDLFAQVQAPLANTVAGQPAPPQPADPRGSPVHAWRLLGVWQQAGTVHAVLGDGEHPIVVQQGQRLGRGAYRVRSIGDGQVELAGAGPAGQVLRLTLQKEKP
jgi:hypothetical protein